MNQGPKLNPSTPPLANLSPDLRSLKDLFRSPAGLKLEEGKELEFGDLDFESAYALLTQSPTFNVSLSPPPTTAVPHPIAPQHGHQQQVHSKPSPAQFDFSTIEGSEQFKDYLFRTRTPSPRLGSPIPLFDIEQFPKYSELLSANESTALEQFLDSIIENPQKKNVTSEANDHISYHKDAGIPDGTTPPTTTGSSHSVVPFEPIITGHPEQLGETHVTADSSRLIPHIASIPKLRSSPEVEGPDDATSQTAKKQRKRRKLLTDEQKKQHHTTSEQRRRGLIKESFDNLVRLLPVSQTKKNQPKSIILESAAAQIEKLTEANRKLKDLLDRI
ncbi:MAX gene-associated protein [Cyberlindnera fabianii]|uniref:MAX gene-associated protein n=1 Tax=Cyberlindnera fabianii TaxID=36022 RepID=A0A1V2L7Y6_CYBFA|nr:MAX gene-associated protein [Cyberlindnera fabianii]